MGGPGRPPFLVINESSNDVQVGGGAYSRPVTVVNSGSGSDRGCQGVMLTLLTVCQFAALCQTIVMVCQVVVSVSNCDGVRHRSVDMSFTFSVSDCDCLSD